MYALRLLSFCLLLAVTAAAPSIAAARGGGRPLPPTARAGDKIAGAFIVQVEGKCTEGCRSWLQRALASQASTKGCSLTKRETVIGGLTFRDIRCPPTRKISETTIASLLSAEAAAKQLGRIRVKQDEVLTAASQSTSLWGVDETDGGVVVVGGSAQRDGLRTCSMSSNNGADVNLWILDSGCSATNGGDCVGYFAGGATPCADGYGHGNHVSGTATDALYGVAFSARRSCIKILGDDGIGSYSNAINAIGHVVSNKGQLANGDVINLSLGGPWYELMNSAVEEAANIERIYFALAAGNAAANACGVSPASAVGDRVFTVQAHDPLLGTPWWTNFATAGSDCTHISAPGVEISSFGGTWSGTSFATPHVAAAIAVQLSDGHSPTLATLTSPGVMINPGGAKLSKPALGLTC